MTTRFADSAVLRRVLERLKGVTRAGEQWAALCPAHDDQTPSLTVREGDTAGVVVYCHRGCTPDAIVAAIGLAMTDLFPPGSTPPKPNAPRIVETYDYCDAPGHVVFQVVRYEPKTFRQRRPDPDKPGEWRWDMKGVQRVLYHLPELRAAIAAGRTVMIVEGERDVHTLERMGFVATTNAGGAGKWKQEYSLHLRGARVVILPDNDDIGRAHGDQVARSLYGIASDLRLLELPGVPPKGDVTDWANAGGTDEQLKQLVRGTAPWLPPVEPAAAAPNGNTPHGEASAESAPDDVLLFAPQTDIGNAERLVHRHGADLRHVTKWAKWLHWDSRRWKIDETRVVERLAKETIRATREVAARLTDEGKRDTLKAFARKSESNGKVVAMLARTQAEHGIAISHDVLEVNPWRLTVLNGTLDLRIGELGEHRREDMYTRLVPIAYDPDAECPRWIEFLDRVMNGRIELITFLQRAIGYSLTGSTREQCLFFLYGTGANGKSKFLQVLRALLGEYFTQADFSTFVDQNKGDGPRNDVARLFGARVVTSVEVGEGKRMNEPVVKHLTGEDVVSARFLYAEAFEFVPTFKVWLAANHKPSIRGTDNAIWRRIRLVPFTVTIPEAERDDSLGEKLLAELPGIFAWAVQGCLLWLESGLGMPDDVRSATDAYRRESDTLGAFIEECCELGEMFSEPAKPLYDAYVTWADESGEFKLSNSKFGVALEERGITVKKSGSKHRVGIRLKEGVGANHAAGSERYERGVAV